MSGRLEPLAEVRVALHKGRSLDVITEARTIVSYWDGLVRPDALATASLFAETVDMFCEPDLALPEIYALLAGAIGAVAASASPAGLVPRFQLRLLHALGLAPADDACVRCGLRPSTRLGTVRTSISKRAGSAACGATACAATRTRSTRTTSRTSARSAPSAAPARRCKRRCTWRAPPTTS